MNAYLAELIGTAFLILLGNGVVANVVLTRTKGHAGGWIVITAGWGIGVFVGAFCSQQYSGAHLNPAVTAAMVIADKLPWNEAGGYLVCQMLGGMLGATLVYLFYRDHYKATEDSDAKLATFCTAPAVRNLPHACFCELVATFALVFPIFLMADPQLQLPVSSLGGIPRICPGSVWDHSACCQSGCWSLASACPWGGPPATRSTRPATWPRVSCIGCSPFQENATATGPTPGFPFSALSREALSPHWPICCSFRQNESPEQVNIFSRTKAGSSPPADLPEPFRLCADLYLGQGSKHSSRLQCPKFELQQAAEILQVGSGLGVTLLDTQFGQVFAVQRKRSAVVELAERGEEVGNGGNALRKRGGFPAPSAVAPAYREVFVSADSS